MCGGPLGFSLPLGRLPNLPGLAWPWPTPGLTAWPGTQSVPGGVCPQLVFPTRMFLVAMEGLTRAQLWHWHHWLGSYSQPSSPFRTAESQNRHLQGQASKSTSLGPVQKSPAAWSYTWPQCDPGQAGWWD